jgi:dinuclear metal center YbgI/SA1388 family protein
MTQAPNLAQVVDVLEDLYPLRYAEEWDAPGLIVGDLRSPVHNVHCAVDPTMAVVDEAIALGADVLITHHPLFFRAVHEVSGLGFRGAIVRKLIEHHCALWVGHTNADAAYRGVAHSAAHAFGLEELKPLLPVPDQTQNHTLGNSGQIGLGRVGTLPEAMSLHDFALRVAKALPHTQAGIQLSGNLDGLVSKVAVLPGSGDSLFAQVRECGADVYVTSDLRHHPATDARQQASYEASMRRSGIALGSGEDQPCPALINTPHSAIESLWFDSAGEDIVNCVEARLGIRLKLTVSDLNTDPWTLYMPTGA